MTPISVGRDVSESNGGHEPVPVIDGNHDAKTGRFVKGNSGGPGSPHTARIHQIRNMVNGTDMTLVEAVWKKAIALALEGNEKMIVYVIDRLIGKPKERVEVDTQITLFAEMRQTILQVLQSPKVAAAVEEDLLEKRAGR